MSGAVYDYAVEYARSPILLAEDVSKLMIVGWEPLGGVAATVDARGREMYCQAMVRRGEE